MDFQLCAPVFVPLNAQHELNLINIPNYYKYLKNNGINCILVNGGCGEFTNLTTQERKDVLKAWVKCLKDNSDDNFELIVNIGACCIEDAIELGKDAANASKNISQLAITPTFYTPITNEYVLLNYIKYVKDQLPNDIKLLYYHIPSRTRVDISLEKLMTIIKQTNYNSISSIKFTDVNIDELATLNYAIQNHRLPIKLYCGYDSFIDKVEVMDIKGAILSEINVYPKLFSDSFNDKIDPKEKNSNLELLKFRFHTVMEFSDKQQADFLALMKLLCEWESGVSLGPMRRPYDLSAGTIEKFKVYLQKNNLLIDE